MEKKDSEQNHIESLFAGNELSRILFECTSDAILFTKESKIIECNEATLLLFGFSSKNEITGKFPFDLTTEFQPDGTYSKSHANEIITSANKNSTQKFNWKFVKTDGTPFEASVILTSFSDHHHQFLQFIIRYGSVNEQIKELEKRKQACIEAEIKYKRIFENVQDVFYRTDLNGIITEISPSIEKYSRYIHADVIGQPIYKFYHNPDDRQKLIDKIRENGEVNDFEVLLKGKNNQLVWGSVNAHFITDESGQIVGIEGTIRDLTERKQAEDKSKLALSLLQATLDSTTDGILVVNLSGKITSYNKQFREMFNHSEETLQQGDDITAIEYVMDQIKDSDQFQSKIQYLYNHPDLDSFDTIELKDGRILERFSCPQRLDGQPIGRVWNFRDVTERKKAEQQLQLIAHTLKSINECISITDIFDRILFVNEAFLKTYGYDSESELIGKNISILRSQNNDMEIVNQILTITADAGWVGEILNRRKDGTDFPISLSTSIVQDENGKILGMVGVAVDITERKLAEQSLIESEERYRSFFEGSPDAIFLADTETGIIIDANPAAAALLKLPLDKIIGIHQSQLHPQRDAHIYKDAFQSSIAKAYSKSSVKTSEILVACSDGSEIPVEILSSVIHIKGKSIVHGVFRNIAERKEAEKALLASEKRFRLLIENQGEGVGLVDPDENFIFVNPAAETIFGMAPGKLVGKNLRKFISPDHLERLHQESQKRSRNKRSSYEIDIVRPDGKIKNILITATPQLNDEGKFVGTFGVFRDITDRRKVEAELQAKEAHLSTLVRTIPDLIWLKDINGVYLTCNKMFEKFFGAPASEIIGKTDYDFVEPELADFFRKNDMNAVAAGKPTSNEEWITFASDGKRALLETIKMPMYDVKGKTIGILGVGRDITARKQAEEQLRQSEIKYRTLIETMPDGVYRSTPEGKFIEVNDAMVNILGYDNKEDLMAIDIKTDLYFDPSDREGLVLKFKPEELDVYPLKKKDGSAVWVEDHGWYVKDENENVIFHEGISRNVTDRKMAELQLQKYSEELQELNATKDKFFSIIAHDLKTPFNSILGLSEILKDEAKNLDIETIIQYSGIIHSTSGNTYQLLENLLDWARVQQSRIIFNQVPILLKKLVLEVIDLNSEAANQKKILIINNIPDKMIISADQEMLKTILRNLISNALKFTSANGKIEITAKSVSEIIEISVKDTGTGISKEDIDKLFKVDSNFTKRGTENEKGTGLGLILCKEFIEKHGGTIWVESEEGKGSTFMFTLKQI